MSSIIELINRRMPQDINKTGEEYKAVFGKTPFTPNVPIVTSADYNCGAIANELEYQRAFLDYLFSCFDVDNAEGDYLEKITNFFLDLKRIWNETDVNLQKRFYALIRRKSNPRWDTNWAIADMFSYFFATNKIIIEENYIETDLLLNGGFENRTGDDFDSWTEAQAGSSTVTADTTQPFEQGTCAYFQIDSSNSGASISQTFNSVAAGNYKLCLFHRDDGNCPTDYPLKVSVQRSGDSYYYNFDENTWQSGAVYKQFGKATDYKYGYAYINNADLRNLTVKIENDGASGTAYAFKVDRVMFGLWQDYPSIKVIVIFTQQSGDFISLWLGDDDNLIDRGECESATSPMIFDETTPTLSNALWAQDAMQKYWGSNSYKFTKNVAAGTPATVDLVENNLTTDLHGLIVGQQYSFIARIRIPSSGILGSEIQLQVMDYDSSWQTSEQACALTYDAWQYVKVTRTIRAAATGAVVRLEADSTAEITEYFNVDDIRVVKGDVGDIELASFFDQDYIGGEGGGYTSDYYLSLLNRARAAGVKGAIEKILRVGG